MMLRDCVLERGEKSEMSQKCLVGYIFYFIFSKEKLPSLEYNVLLYLSAF